MKKIQILCILISAVFLLFRNICADNDPDTLLATADSEIFTKAGFIQDYSEAQGYVNEFAGGDILHQYFIKDGKGTDVLTSLQPLPQTISVTNKRLKFDDRRAKVFHASYEVQQSESIPGNAGYCWIRYSDTVIAGAGRESGIILYPGYKAFFFTPVNGEMEYTEIADLTEYNKNRNLKIEVIRLDGISYFYFNGVYKFKYDDGIVNPVSFEGGTELLEGANRIRCDFDNFIFLTQ